MTREKKAQNKDHYEQLNNGPNNNKQQEATSFQKLLRTLHRLFVRQQKIPQTISRAVVAATYFQILQIINIILLYTIFKGTNSDIYSLIITILTIFLVLIDTIPKISKKHLIFSFVSISQGLILVGIMISIKVLLQNYLIFRSHCSDFLNYFQRRQQSTQASIYWIDTSQKGVQSMCSSVLQKFYLQIGIECFFILAKVVHLVLYFIAYRLAKERFEDEQKKKRRKDRYNEMMRKKYVYNDKKRA